MRNKLVFKKNGIEHSPLKSWELNDGNIVAIYQGSRGARPDLDFVVKYLAPGKRLRAPSHTHWIVDLLIKADAHKNIVSDYITSWIERYDTMEPFNSVEERNNYNMVYSNQYKNNISYEDVSNCGYYSIEFISTLIELFIRCEKQTPGAFMFRNLLGLMNEYCMGKKDFYQVIGFSKRV